MGSTYKNRVIYQSQALYAGQVGTDGSYIAEQSAGNKPIQLQRVQSANYNFEITRQDVNQFGNLAAIDRVILDQPTVGLDTSWYVCSLWNEKCVGFHINQGDEYGNSTFHSCIKNILARTADERNYYIRIVKEGSDAADFALTGADTNDSANETIGIGNGFLSSYTVEASVGGFPTATVAVEGLNIVFYDGITGFSPFVVASNGAKNEVKQFELPDAKTSTTTTADGDGYAGTVLKPGDIGFTLPDLDIGADTGDVKVQSFNITLDLGREPLQKLGSRYAYAREIAFPVTISCSVDALVGNMDTGNLADKIENDPDHTLIFKLNKGANQHMAYVLKKAKLDSMDFSNTVGDNKSVTMNFSLQVGSAEQDDVGMFMSGVTASDTELPLPTPTPSPSSTPA